MLFIYVQYAVILLYVPCHHSITCFQIVDGGGGLQIKRVTVNISLGWGLTTPHHKILLYYKSYTRPWMDSLEQTTQWKMGTQF